MSCLMRLFNFRRRGVPASNANIPIPEPSDAQLKSSTADALAQDLDSMLLGIQPEQGFFALTLVGRTDFVSPEHIRSEISQLAGFATVSRLEVTSQRLILEFPTAGDAALAMTSHPAVVVRGQTFHVQYADVRVADDPVQPAQEPPRKKLKTESATEPVQLPECKICFEKLEGLYSTPCLSCKHAYCYDCLENMVSTALNDPECFPSRCCGRLLHFDAFNGIVPAADLNKYKLRFEEHSTVKPVYCAHPSCSKFLPPRLAPPDEHGLVCCPQCSATTCSRCRTVVKDADEQHKCPPFDLSAFFLKNFSYKTCPRCNAGVARMFGCPHMRCSCGAHWCWDCQRPIRLCWSRPCEDSREDGNETDEEWTPHREDIDDDSNSSTVLGNNEDHATEPTGDDTVEVPVDTDNAQDEVNTRHVSNTAVGHEAQAEPESAPSTIAATTGDAVPATVTAAAGENTGWATATVNLDSDDETWEHSGLDFGAEPVDESSDMWGCLHDFHPLFERDIPKFWITSVAESQRKQTDEFGRNQKVTCLRCYKVVRAGFKQDSIGAKEGICEGKIDAEQVRPNTAVTLVQVKTEPTEQLSQSRRKGKGGLCKEACPFSCKSCGVVYCFDCKKVENKKLSRALNRNIPIEAVR